MSINRLFMISNIFLALFGVIPIASANGVAIVSIDMNGGRVTNLGAAAAIGDGVSIAGVSTQTHRLLNKSQFSQESQTENCQCYEQVTNAFAINSDGDVDISGLMNSSNDFIIIRSR